MQSDAQCKDGFRWQTDVASCDGETLCPTIANAERLQSVIDEIKQSSALPMLPGQQVVRTGQRKEARLDGFSDRLRIGSVLEPLPNDRLHSGERVLHPMVELIDQRLCLCVRLFMLADIHKRNEMLNDSTSFIPYRADENRCPALGAILAAIVDFRIAI
jgi:hypothetical protein